MEFEFDASKSKTNREKHGIDFDHAKALWSDVDALEIAARDAGGERRALIARHDGKYWTAIFTQRGLKLRIISVRRSRKNERDLYDQL